MTAHGIHEAQIKRIRTALIREGSYGSYTLSDAFESMSAEYIMRELLQAEDSIAALNVTARFQEIASKRVDLLAARIAEHEQLFAIQELSKRQEDLAMSSESFTA